MAPPAVKLLDLELGPYLYDDDNEGREIKVVFSRPSRRATASRGHVEVFPNPEAPLRLAGAVLVEAHDEWQTSDRGYLAEDSMALLTATTNDDTVGRRTAHGMI